ncbi:MAG: universal stress protein [Lewinella sp.]|uniref:universal stress protein n=1 Tax=Lewinella sp. TaxID=2004506 RepID=UPI003D6C6B37
MNILCPIDFSNTSVKACGWAARFLQQTGGGKLQLLHCVNVVSRSAMFIKMDDIFKEQAENDFKELLPKVRALAPDVEVSANIVFRDPKTFIPDYAGHHKFDLIVNGTKGLTALKDITVGSVTAYLMDRSPVPLLTIPEEADFRPVQKIILGVDSEVTEAAAFQTIINLARKAKAELVFVNTNEDITSIEETEAFTLQIEGISSKGFVIPQGVSIPQTLTDFSVEQEADILVLIHRKRQWYERLFKTSVAKEELFKIKTPLLILPMDAE